MIGKILGALVALIVIVIVLGFVLPDKVTLEREVVIEAPQEDVFVLISDFNEWNKWSPWANIDPEAEFELTGEPGIGQRMSWKSDHPEVGNGTQEMTAFEPPNSITTGLDFGAQGVASATFILSPAGDNATNVKWTFKSNMRKGVPFHMKPVATYMGFMMEKFLGPAYETGLANLKATAEQTDS